MGLLDQFLVQHVDPAKRRLRGLLTDPGAYLEQTAYNAVEQRLPGFADAAEAQSVMPGMGAPFREKIQNLALGGMTKFEKAHKVAQKNAALPIELGGLGLPKNNTAADRAKALGFDTKAFRGSQSDEVSARGARWWSEDPGYANAYAASLTKVTPDDYAGNVMPLLVNKGNAKKFEKLGIGGVPEYGFKVGDGGVDTGYRLGFAEDMKTPIILEGLTVPQNVRSKFAAFDPKKRKATDLLASIATLGLLGSGIFNADEQ